MIKKREKFTITIDEKLSELMDKLCRRKIFQINLNILKDL